MKIRFGTSGWRGILADDFGAAGVRALAAAVARWALESGTDPRVVVARDTRFMGEYFADVAARVLSAAGIRPVRASDPVPTPVASFAVRQRRAAAGIIITASHNPPEYQGLKVVAPWGGGPTREITDRLEAWAAEVLATGPPPEAEPRGREVDLTAAYLDTLTGELDRSRLRRSGLRVCYDALHGAGAGTLDEALRRSGVAVTVRRGEWDPRFGGEAPDPTPDRLVALARDVRRGEGLRLGIATDGDADRFAGIDADGRLLSETDSLALLVDHLARSGRIRRGVAISSATGSLVERVARSHGLSVRRFPIGFKHLSRALVEGEADLAGEESGGFAWGRVARDKDGILAGCLLAELVATTAAPLRVRLAELMREHGRRASGRIALPADDRLRRGLSSLRGAPPSRVDGARVLDRDLSEGLRLTLEDGFLMFRASGTEPVLRIYAEARGPRLLSERLRSGMRLLARAAGRASRGS